MSIPPPTENGAPPVTPRIILASGSPRRRDLLAAGGLGFEVIVSDADEDNPRSTHPRAVAMELALAKATAVAARLPPDAEPAVILAADTIVVLDDEILGKPADRSRAAAMLGRLSGRTHEVITGVAVMQHPPGATHVDAARSRVTFKILDPALIESYAASGECDDKAGAYGLQGRGREFIRSVEGEVSNVIGLPISTVRAALETRIGRDPFGARSEAEIIAAAWPGLADFDPARSSASPGEVS